MPKTNIDLIVSNNFYSRIPISPTFFFLFPGIFPIPMLPDCSIPLPPFFTTLLSESLILIQNSKSWNIFLWKKWINVKTVEYLSKCPSRGIQIPHIHALIVRIYYSQTRVFHNLSLYNLCRAKKLDFYSDFQVYVTLTFV